MVLTSEPDVDFLQAFAGYSILLYGVVSVSLALIVIAHLIGHLKAHLRPHTTIESLLKEALSETEADGVQANRNIGDGLSDAAVGAVNEARDDDIVWNPRVIMHEVVSSKDPACVAFIQHMREDPEVWDYDMIAEGQDVFFAFFAQLGISLLAVSLPIDHIVYNSAPVSASTGGMVKEKVPSRMYNTLWFVYSLASASRQELEAGGKGREAIMNIRLLHSRVRYYLRHEGDVGFDESTFGAPICQDDMVIMSLALNFVAIEASTLLFGMSLTDRQRDSWRYMWRFIAHYIGVDLKLLPRTYAEERALLATVLLAQMEISDTGRRLYQSVAESGIGFPVSTPKWFIQMVTWECFGPKIFQELSRPTATSDGGIQDSQRVAARDILELSSDAPVPKWWSLAVYLMFFLGALFSVFLWCMGRFGARLVGCVVRGIVKVWLSLASTRPLYGPLKEVSKAQSGGETTRRPSPFGVKCPYGFGG